MGCFLQSARCAVAAQDLVVGRVVGVKEVDSSPRVVWAEEPEDIFYLGEQLAAAFKRKAPVGGRLSHECVDGDVESRFLPVGYVVLLSRRRW